MVVGVVLMVAMGAKADIVTFTVDQTFSQGADQYDVDETPISLGGAGSFYVDPGASEFFFDFAFYDGGRFSTINTAFEFDYVMDSYSAGEIISGDDFGAYGADSGWVTILSNGNTAGVWGSSHDGFLGFRSSGGLYGWIEYSFTRAGGVSTMQLKNGAYNTVANEGIKAVPEPMAAGLVTLAGASLLLVRRFLHA